MKQSDLRLAMFMLTQGLIKLIQKHEVRWQGNALVLRQLLEVAGTVLLDIEITLKHITQNKVRQNSANSEQAALGRHQCLVMLEMSMLKDN